MWVLKRETIIAAHDAAGKKKPLKGAAQREVRENSVVADAAVFFDNDLKQGIQMSGCQDAGDYRETISTREINSGYAGDSFYS
ncbi:MAG TPA: hypothetical protein VF682_16765 [Pseudomonas sp.]